MAADWLESLDPVMRAKAQQMIDRLAALGCPDAEQWVQSEIQEDIPQTARYLVLRRLWQYIDDWQINIEDYLPRLLSLAGKDSEQAFADGELALKKMVDAGVRAEDIGAFARMVAYESMFTVVEIIDEGYD